MLNNENCYKKIEASVTVNIAELFLMILKLHNKIGLGLKGLPYLTQLINGILDKKILPSDPDKLDAIFNNQENVTYHATCPHCGTYAGKLEDLEDDFVCSNSKCLQTSKWSNPSLENLFSVINPSTAVAELLSQHEEYYDYVVRERKHEEGIIQDIYDGDKYLEFVNSLGPDDRQNYVTCIGNTDGATPYRFSKKTVWPVYIMLNEIPPQERLNKVIVVGLWFGKTKPDLNMLLDPIIDMMNELSENGIKVKIKGESRNIKLYNLVYSLDAMARSPAQGTKCCTGYNGCCWCLHPGNYDTFSQSIKYPVIHGIKYRDKESTERIMLMTNQKKYKPIDGIKRASALINLNHFDIIWGLVVEYLHCVLIGAAKRVLMLLLGVQDMNNLESFIKKIKLPIHVRRLTRPLSDRKYWNAKDWENFILYYSLPLLSLVIDKDYLTYWSLFVEAVHILLGTRIPHSDIKKADQLLRQFVFETQEKLSISAMYFVIHQLLHIAKSVRDWGPLWATSAFSFESANHYMMLAIKNAYGAILQIQRYVNYSFCLSILEKKVFKDASEIVKKYCLHTIQSRVKNANTLSKNITYLGKGEQITEKFAIEYCFDKMSKRYYKLIKDHCLYSSCDKINVRSNNSVAQLVNGKFILIKYFIVDSLTNKDFVIYYELKTKKHSLTSGFENLQVVESTGNILNKIVTTQIRRICANFKIGNIEYVCPLPHLLSY